MVSDKNPTVSQNSKRQPDLPLAGQRQLLIYRHPYSLNLTHFRSPVTAAEPTYQFQSVKSYFI